MFQALQTINIPKTVMVDFEKAMMNKINYEFPETEAINSRCGSLNEI